jgi:hypothetical protein
VSFLGCVLLEVVYGGRESLLPLPAVGAGKGFVSRVRWRGMAIGNIASPPFCLLGPFGSDVRGGPCCGCFHHTVPILVRWQLLQFSPSCPMLQELWC